MGDRLRLRLGASLVAAVVAAAAATVLAPLPAAALLIVAAALAGGLLGRLGALFALPLLLFADGAVAKVAVALAGALPGLALYGWRRWSARGERIRADTVAAERARLAREMHDSLSQTLDAVALGAAPPDGRAEPDQSGRHAATPRDGDREATRDAGGLIEEPDQSGRHAATPRDGNAEAARARGVIDEPRTDLADAPLPDLVAAISQEWSARTGVGVILHSAGLDGEAGGDAAPRAGIELCWILREALRNVAAHARAETVAVTLGRDGDEIMLEVRDDGAGFVIPESLEALAQPQRDGHHGLAGMHERARLCGGHLSVWSRPGGGTRITATVPAAAAVGASRPSGRLRLIAAVAAAAVPLAVVAFLATPDKHPTPLAAQDTELPLDPRATHGPVTAGPAPVTPGRSPASSGPTPASSGPTPGASRSPSGRAAAPSSAPAVPAAPAGPTSPATTHTCKVTYVKISEWNPGFVAAVTITNTGSSPLGGWSLRFEYPAGQKVTSYWNAAVTQSGPVVVAGAEGNSRAIAPGASFTFGVQGTWQGSNPNPAAFALNGAPCG
ncbi:cellulose binding domain-containing protein [Dactylosporangium sp. NPDC000555]|uniref:cellulose binding domain-containing protein n=1 Tax=Dactylosporangium sp. NPDC000555 TaxID=3154260 RepID=UPI0033348A5B